MSCQAQFGCLIEVPWCKNCITDISRDQSLTCSPDTRGRRWVSLKDWLVPFSKNGVYNFAIWVCNHALYLVHCGAPWFCLQKKARGKLFACVRWKAYITQNKSRHPKYHSLHPCDKYWMIYVRIGFMLPNFPCSCFENSAPIFVQKMVLFALIVTIAQHPESKHVCLMSAALH